MHFSLLHALSLPTPPPHPHFQGTDFWHVGGGLSRLFWIQISTVGAAAGFDLRFSCQAPGRGRILFPLAPGLALCFGGSGTISPRAGNGCTVDFAVRELVSWWQQQAADFLKSLKGEGLFLSLIKPPYLQPARHICLFLQKQRCSLPGQPSTCSRHAARDWGLPARDEAGGDSLGWESLVEGVCLSPCAGSCCLLPGCQGFGSRVVQSLRCQRCILERESKLVLSPLHSIASSFTLPEEWRTLPCKPDQPSCVAISHLCHPTGPVLLAAVSPSCSPCTGLPLLR